MANVFGDSWDAEVRDVKMASVTSAGGAELLGATVYELAPGARWAELHVHFANEELIVVLTGAPTVHTLDGSRTLAAGDVVVCPRGRRGAHRLENETEDPVRVLIVSTTQMPEVVEYPERDRVFVMTEPPYSDGLHDPEAHGRLLRVFEREAGQPVPPDA